MILQRFFFVTGLIIVSVVQASEHGSEQAAQAPAHTSASLSPTAVSSPSFVSGPVSCQAGCVPVELLNACQLELEKKSKPPMTKEEKTKLLSEFRRALSDERKALEHRQSFEIKELKASHASRFKEFLDKDHSTRREVFKTAEKGADRRAWMAEHKKRRETLESVMSEELENRKNEHTVRKAALDQSQKERLAEFESSLEKGETPPKKLWPQPGAF